MTKINVLVWNDMATTVNLRTIQFIMLAPLPIVFEKACVFNELTIID